LSNLAIRCLKRVFLLSPPKGTNNICLPLLFLSEGAISAGEAGEEAEAKHCVGPHPGVGHQAAGQACAVNSAPPGSQVLGLCHLKYYKFVYQKYCNFLTHKGHQSCSFRLSIK